MQQVTAKWAPPQATERLEQLRWAVVDVETTGLNLRKDRVIAIGGVEIVQMKINLNTSFERVFDPGITLDHDNVLIHGLSPQELQQGVTADSALRDFLQFAARAPLLAFHAPFDKRMLEKECKLRLGLNAGLPFYDLADWCPVLFPEPGKQLQGLDAWLDYFGLDIGERHHATCDAMATAELALICLQKIVQEGFETWGQWIEKANISVKLARHRHFF